MTVTISIGSGKGGTGKTMIMTNLALLLARKGKKVCLVDLDIGGADAHILLGLFSPQYTITDFLTRKIATLQEAVHTFYAHNGLQFIAGTGNTLQTANMTFQEKQRLLRELEKLDAEIVLLDVGAGTGYHALDFFMYADLQICVALPDPTSILDLYTFLQLGTVRKILSSFLSQSDVAVMLKNNKFDSLQEVFDLAEKTQPGSRLKAQAALKYFHPLLIINRNSTNSQVNMEKLAGLVTRYLGISIPELGHLPSDSAADEALKTCLPVAALYPSAPVTIGLQKIADKLEKLVTLFGGPHR